MNRRHFSADHWRGVLQDQMASGLSVWAYCQREGVPQATLYAWRKRLAKRGGFVELTLPQIDAERDPAGPTEALAAPCGPAPAVELRLPGRRRLLLRPGFDRQTLRDVLQILEAAS